MILELHVRQVAFGVVNTQQTTFTVEWTIKLDGLVVVVNQNHILALHGRSMLQEFAATSIEGKSRPDLLPRVAEGDGNLARRGRCRMIVAVFL